MAREDHFINIVLKEGIKVHIFRCPVHLPAEAGIARANCFLPVDRFHERVCVNVDEISESCP